MRKYNEDMKKEYLNYCTNELYFSELSIERYNILLNQYFAYIEEFELNVLKVNKNDLKIFISGLYDLQYKKTSISNAISILKSFYHYLMYRNHIKNNPTDSLVYPKRDTKLPNYLHVEELYKIIDSIDTNATLGSRNLAIVLVLYSCGLRVFELVNLKIKDINFNDSTLIVLGKNNKERIVPFDLYTKEILEQYIITTRIALLSIDTDHVFLNNRGQNLTERGVRHIIKKCADDAALLTKVSPHTFRHSLATHLLQNGMDIRYVQEILGHSSLSTTQVYTHVAKQDMKNKYKKFNSRSK